MCMSRDPVAVGFLLGAGSTIHVESPLLREELLAPSPKPADSMKVELQTRARAAARGSQRSRNKRQ